MKLNSWQVSSVPSSKRDYWQIQKEREGKGKVAYHSLDSQSGIVLFEQRFYLRQRFSDSDKMSGLGLYKNFQALTNSF